MTITLKSRIGGSFVLSLCLFNSANALDLMQHPQLNVFVDEMVVKHGFSRDALRRLFEGVTLRDNVLKAIQRPAERLPWFRYRKLLVTAKQASDGAMFWKKYESDLERAALEFGIPPQVIVAIIGVETRYGRVNGSHSVLDALTTLMLGYPRRYDFFRRELEEYLLLTREEGLDPTAINGSYAGAMGVPQFISSSYRRYAVDFNGDQRRDLISEPVDAIGSVANYLHAHNWQKGAPIAAEVDVPGGVAPEGLVSARLETTTTINGLRQLGLALDTALPDDIPVSLVRLEGDSDFIYRIAFENFYVITRYNRSVHYAMAVYDLSREIEEKFSTL